MRARITVETMDDHGYVVDTFVFEADDYYASHERQVVHVATPTQIMDIKPGNQELYTIVAKKGFKAPDVFVPVVTQRYMEE